MLLYWYIVGCTPHLFRKTKNNVPTYIYIDRDVTSGYIEDRRSPVQEVYAFERLINPFIEVGKLQRLSEIFVEYRMRVRNDKYFHFFDIASNQLKNCKTGFSHAANSKILK